METRADSGRSDPFTPAFQARLQSALERATRELLAARGAHGHWEGELSSSALSTATAVCALAIVERASQAAGSAAQSEVSHTKSQIAAGLDWLAKNANADGGWGDTTLSLSNLSTTALCWAAFGAVPGADEQHRPTVARAEAWLAKQAGGIEPATLAPAIIRRYGKDRTFSVPILTMCALAGRLGAGREAWRWVIPLPFELAACPHQWFAALRLPVVSYALPALIAIGQARHHHRPTRNPLTRALRHLTRSRTLKVLTEIQPTNGGFLEATPLTSFVTMSLAGSGLAEHPVAKKGAAFLRASQRADGSWPIDTNLATWLTTLSVHALSIHHSPFTTHDSPLTIRAWLLGQQYRHEHPYTYAAPGGWAWNDLPGGVPDADDTAGALLALRELGPIDETTRQAALAGIKWLLDLQNTDGGIPTFCRGWGTLPFDHSSPDLTAHAIRAWLAWLEALPPRLRDRALAAVRRALGFLAETQRRDGSWLPLWFGNQFAPEEANPTYGTARVLCALAVLSACAPLRTFLTPVLARRAVRWLVEAQNADGGWGGAPGVRSSVEETALAVEALAGAKRSHLPEADAALARGAAWLVERVESGQWTQPSPLGFYFAKLWYYERLYPMIFTVGALAKANGYRHPVERDSGQA